MVLFGCHIGGPTVMLLLLCASCCRTPAQYATWLLVPPPVHAGWPAWTVLHSAAWRQPHAFRMRPLAARCHLSLGKHSQRSYLRWILRWFSVSSFLTSVCLGNWLPSVLVLKNILFLNRYRFRLFCRLFAWSFYSFDVLVPLFRFLQSICLYLSY